MGLSCGLIKKKNVLYFLKSHTTKGSSCGLIKKKNVLYY